MLRLGLLVLICWGIFISTAMAFMPGRVLGYAMTSRIWMWYLGKVFNVTRDVLSRETTMRWVQIQGAIGLIAALLALYAWVRQ
jgi:hypothetical protein